jgi:hypothetical protein
MSALGWILVAALWQDPPVTTEPATKEFVDRALNLSFRHPLDWKLVRQDRRAVVFEIPAANGPAQLELIRTQFGSEPEVWQTVQVRTNELAKRTTVRQYEQQVLGAPVLMTLSEYEEGGVPKNRLTGLFYTRNRSKLLFHLASPKAAYDEALFRFQQVFETLRSLTGSEFAPEDPANPTRTDPNPEQLPPVDAPKRVSIEDGTRELGRPKFTRDLSAPSGSVYRVSFWDPWRLEQNVLGFGAFSGTVNVRVESGFSADNLRWITVTSANELSRFQKVGLRYDQLIPAQRSGLRWFVRIGEDTSGPLLRAVAIAGEGTDRLVIELESRDAGRFGRFERDFRRAAERVRFEPAP